MSSKNNNLDRLIEELEKRWQVEWNVHILRRIRMEWALRDNDMDLFRRLLDEEYRNFPRGLPSKDQQSFWETFVSYALVVWVILCLLAFLIGIIHTLAK